MEKPEKVQSSAGYNSGEVYYRADEIDAYVAELKASLAEMVELVGWIERNYIMEDDDKVQLTRARALIGEE
jgi:hypothetical protein